MKIKRDAFIYLAPQGDENEFAQCGACSLFAEGRRRCAILGAAEVVRAEYSCGLFVYGNPHDQPVRAVYTPEEVGLVRRQVRCENCASSDGEGACNLYKKLNEALPDTFDLDTEIDAKACCNAQTPKE